MPATLLFFIGFLKRCVTCTHLFAVLCAFAILGCKGNDTYSSNQASNPSLFDKPSSAIDQASSEPTTAQNKQLPNASNTHLEKMSDYSHLVLPTTEESVFLGDPPPTTTATAIGNSKSLVIDEEALVMATNAPLDEKGNIRQMGLFEQNFSLEQNPSLKAKRELVVKHPQCKDASSHDSFKHCLRFSENQQIPAAQFKGSKHINQALTIEASQTVCTAPCGIHFTANIDTAVFSVDNAWNDVAYSWNFDDPTSTFDALNNDFIFGKSANFSQGPVAAHVFSKPGHYRVAIQIAEQGGKYSEAFKDIIVTDTDAFYPQQQTICVSQENDFTDCPSGAQLFTQWNNAINTFARNRKGNSYRLLLKSGEVFHSNKTTLLSRNGPYLISKFGEGKNPIIKTDARISVFHALRVEGFTIASVDIQGNYNSSTGMGESYAAKAINTTSTNNITIYQTKSTGIGIHALITGGQGVVIADNIASNWHDYASLNQGWDQDQSGEIEESEYAHKVAYIGNNFKQSQMAVSGSGDKGGKAPRWADHGPIRSAGSFGLIVSQNDLLSTTGWSSNGQAHQPALRYNQSGVPNHSGVINRNRLSGGWIVLQLSPQNTLYTACLGKLLVERNHLIGSSNTIYMTRISYGDITLRNNIMEVPDVKDDGKMLPFTSMIDLDFGPSTQKNIHSAKRIYGNTFVQLQSETPANSFSLMVNSDNSTNIERRAIKTHLNMLYSPNLRGDKNGHPLTTITVMDERKRPLVKQLKHQKSVKGLFDGFYGEFRHPDQTNAGAISMFPSCLNH